MLSGLLAVLIGGCQAQQVFACTDDASCPNGWCEADGYCSFPDAECESGRRFGKFSGPLSSQCVAEGEATTSRGTETTSASAEGSGDTGEVETTLGTTSGTTSGPTSGPTSGLGDSSDGSETTAEPDGCATGSTCFDAAPAGWSGPVVVLEGGGEQAPCAAIEGLSAVLSGAEAYSSDWSCACSCEAEPEDCPSSVTMEMYEGSGCEGDPLFTEDVGPSCQDLGYVDFYSVVAEAQVSLSCTASPLLNAGTVGPDGPKVVCEADMAPSCTAGTCLPDDAGPTACIWTAEEVECPAGPYSVQTVLYRSYQDERNCGPCTCQASGECEGSLYVATDLEGCEEGATMEEVTIGECSEDASLVRGAYVDVDSTAEVDSCQTDGGQPSGGLVPSDPVTICCLP